MEVLTQQIDDLFTGSKWEFEAFQRVVVCMDTMTLRRVYQIAEIQEEGMLIRLREMEACLKHHGDYQSMLIQSNIISLEECEEW